MARSLKHKLQGNDLCLNVSRWRPASEKGISTAFNAFAQKPKTPGSPAMFSFPS
jgi:hypothetical protein